jgi:hypothetical protein
MYHHWSAKLCRIYDSCLYFAHRLSRLLHAVKSISRYNVIPLYTKKPVHFNAILLPGMLSCLSAFRLDILFDLNCLERRQEETWSRALSFHSDLILHSTSFLQNLWRTVRLVAQQAAIFNCPCSRTVACKTSKSLPFFLQHFILHQSCRILNVDSASITLI